MNGDAPVPPPPPYPPTHHPYGSDTPYTHKPRLSAMAVTAFVLSLLGCSSILGLIFGVIGIFTTSGGRRRGRGFAVAAIPISIVTGTACYGLGYYTITFVIRIFMVADRLETTLQLSPDNLDRAVDELTAISTNQLQADVSKDQMRAWLQLVDERYGRLDSISTDTLQIAHSQPSGDRLLIAFDFQAQFTGGPVNIRITIPQEALKILIDDVTIGDLSLRKRAQPEP